MGKNYSIALFGATSHIAKGLIQNFIFNGDYELFLFSRSPEKLISFLNNFKDHKDSRIHINNDYSALFLQSYDVIINCVGVGTYKKLNGKYFQYFTITEEYDNLAIRYISTVSPETMYISLSSGVVYGSNYSEPFDKNTEYCIKVNYISPEQYYSIARLNAETKHRSLNHLNIVDIRLFSYFSRYIDLNDGYFITDVLKSLINKEVLITDQMNIIRDYLHPQDLFSMVHCCMLKKPINAVFDVTSKKPVEKWEILNFFSKEYGLKYEVSKTSEKKSATGTKNVYYSKNLNALSIGYKPQFSSLTCIGDESRYILKK